MPWLQRLLALDLRLSARLAVPQGARFLRLLGMIIAHSGDSPLWVIVAVATITWGDAAWRACGWRILAGTLAAGTVTAALKWIFRRSRPPGQRMGFYSAFDRHAFPSGHAGRSACIALLTCPLLPPWTCVAMASWVGLVGLARVSLQVHFASDVLGGWVTGILVGFGLLAAF